MKFITAEEAVKSVKSGDGIYVHGSSATPTFLVDALVKRAPELKDVTFYHLHTYGDLGYTDLKYKDSFHVKSLFTGENVRHTLKQGNGSYIPIFFSQMGRAITERIIKIDVALIQVSEPDAHGFYSLGTSVENTREAVAAARVVIAQVNKHMPRIFGDTFLHESQITHFVEHNAPLYTHEMGEPTQNEKIIGQHIAELIEDRSCLQMGIGSIPNAVLLNLNNHKDLGIHTELFSDGIIPLVKSGVINGEYKAILKGKIVSTFTDGSQKLYDFLNDNPQIELRSASFTNDIIKIAANDRTVSINSAIEVDLTGQVCADSIGSRIYSGVGGQMDFVTGAMRSNGGKSIIALTSVTNKGMNKIVPFLKTGAGVVTTRAHVDYIITEFGVAHLFGKSIKERVEAMARIAHPDFREQIVKDYYDNN